MTDKTTPKDALKRLIWPLRLTRAGLVAERAVRAFWSVWTIAMLAVAVFAFGATDVLPLAGLWSLLLVIAGGLGWTLYRGVRAFKMPTRAEAMARLDQTLPSRPITALADTQAFGGDNPRTQAVWDAHVARMADRAAEARAPNPDLRISDRDPYALRLMATTAFAMALLFGGLWRVGDIGDVVIGTGQAQITDPSWEGWVEPPLYTGLPSIYLNDIAQAGFEAPAGSKITVRFYGEAGAISLRQTVSDSPPPEEGADASARDIVLERSGEVAIEGANGRSWLITALEDQPPTVVMGNDMTGIPPGQMQFSFSASDDYAVVSGQARLALDPGAADRQYGLAVAPEPREALVLNLPMPFSGSREEFSELLVEDLSKHPFANLPVTMTLTVVDHAGQIGTISETIDRLPGRRFFDPLANALIEQRRDILWSRENADRAAQILRAVSHRPEGIFDNEGAYLIVRTAIRRLESAVDGISTETQDQVADILWNAAIQLEEGDLADALDRLRRAQDRLSEAMRQGASDEEIAQLMDELREAMDDYMRQLAENAEPGDDQPDQSGERMEMSQADLDEMLRRIEELMQQGRMAEAQEMLDALREMMENMQITQGEGSDGPQSPGQRTMEDLQGTLRGQQGLSDDSFSELQEQFNQGRTNPQPGRPGQPSEQQPGDQQGEGEGGEGDGRSLAERQEDLRRQLQDQTQNLPGQGTEGGKAARRALDEAARAMEDAVDALDRGDLAEALDSQSDAMEALRDGMGELGRALAEEEGVTEPGQGQAEGNSAPDSPLLDPLGRQAGNSGAFGTEEGFEQREKAFRRARDLLDEIRRRSAERDRPQIELEYLRRLLDQF